MSHPVRHVHWNQTWIESFAGEDCIYEHTRKKGKRKILLSINYQNRSEWDDSSWGMFLPKIFWGEKVWHCCQNNFIQFSYTLCPLLNSMLSFSFHFHIIWKKAIIHKLVHPDQFPSFSLWKIWLSSLHFRSWLGESNV